MLVLPSVSPAAYAECGCMPQTPYINVSPAEEASVVNSVLESYDALSALNRLKAKGLHIDLSRYVVLKSEDTYAVSFIATESSLKSLAGIIALVSVERSVKTVAFWSVRTITNGLQCRFALSDSKVITTTLTGSGDGTVIVRTNNNIGPLMSTEDCMILCTGVASAIVMAACCIWVCPCVMFWCIPACGAMGGAVGYSICVGICGETGTICEFGCAVGCGSVCAPFDPFTGFLCGLTCEQICNSIVGWICD